MSRITTPHPRCTPASTGGKVVFDILREEKNSLTNVLKTYQESGRYEGEVIERWKARTQFGQLVEELRKLLAMAYPSSYYPAPILKFEEPSCPLISPGAEDESVDLRTLPKYSLVWCVVKNRSREDVSDWVRNHSPAPGVLAYGEQWAEAFPIYPLPIRGVPYEGLVFDVACGLATRFNFGFRASHHGLHRSISVVATWDPVGLLGHECHSGRDTAAQTVVFSLRRASCRPVGEPRAGQPVVPSTSFQESGPH
jgi:hypothetical protein